MAKIGEHTQRFEKGIATVEATIVLPVLFLLLTCAMDLYILMDNYSAFVQISREAALTGARLEVTPPEYSGSESGLNPTFAEVQSCYQSSMTGECVHRVLQWRLRRLFESSRIEAAGEIDVESDVHYLADLESTSMGYHLVEAGLAAPPRTVFTFFRGKIVRSSASAG